MSLHLKAYRSKGFVPRFMPCSGVKVGAKAESRSKRMLAWGAFR